MGQPETLRTFLEGWDTAATVLSVLIGAFVLLVGGVITWFRTGPVDRKAKAAEARESDASAHKMTVEGLYGLVDRLETRLEGAEGDAAQAKAEAAQAKTEASAAHNEIGTLRQDMDDIRARYDVLREWVNRIVSNWSVLRQSEDPPPLPPEVHREDHQYSMEG